METMIPLSLPLRRLLLSVACCVGFSGTLGARPAQAQTEAEDPVKEARKMFHQALELEQAGNWSGALRLLREVSQVRMTPQVRFHIAVCEENLGKLVAALGGYELALADADSVGEAFRTEVEAKIAALRVRIPKLVIERGEGAKAATIELDGITLGESSIGVEVPVDPGPHWVQAKAFGHQDYSATIEVPEGATETVSVTLSREKAAAKPKPDDTSPPPAPPRSSPRILPIALIGGGGAFLVGAGTTLFMRSIALSDLRSLCPGYRCPADLTNNEEDAIDSARRRANTLGVLAPAFAVVGVGAAGAGVYLLVRKSPTNQDAATTSPIRRHSPWLALAPAADGSGAGLTLSGCF